MTGVTDIKQLIKDLDTETNAVAAKQDAEIAKIAELQAQITAGNPATAQDLQDIVDGLTPISTRLKALGADPAVPIPPVVPTVV